LESRRRRAKGEDGFYWPESHVSNLAVELMVNSPGLIEEQEEEELVRTRTHGGSIKLKSKTQVRFMAFGSKMYLASREGSCVESATGGWSAAAGCVDGTGRCGYVATTNTGHLWRLEAGNPRRYCCLQRGGAGEVEGEWGGTKAMVSIGGFLFAFGPDYGIKAICTETGEVLNTVVTGGGDFGDTWGSVVAATPGDVGGVEEDTTEESFFLVATSTNRFTAAGGIHRVGVRGLGPNEVELSVNET